jgi:hypothetical protein
LFWIQEVNLDLVKVRRLPRGNQVQNLDLVKVRLLQDLHRENQVQNLHLDHLHGRLRRQFQIDLQVAHLRNLVKVNHPLNLGDVQEAKQIEMLPMMTKTVSLHRFIVGTNLRMFGKLTRAGINIIRQELQNVDNMR